jgi:hypothetical protein
VASPPRVNVPRVVPQPAAQHCQVSPVYIRNLRYDDYSPYARLTSTNVPLGGFIQISTSCLRFDGRVIVTLQDTARGNGFGVTAFQLTNVRVNGNVVIAQLPTQALFGNRSFHVAVFVYGTPWKTANAGTVAIR